MNPFRRAMKALVGMFSGTPTGRAMMSRLWGARVGDPPIRGTKEFLEVYASSPWIRAVAGRVSSEIGATTWTLEARGQTVPEDHLMLQTLRNPNPQMSGHALFKVTQLSLDLVGDAFWLKARNGFGAPVELWPIPPHWIVETPTPMRPSYRVQYYAWQEEIAESEILWAHDPAPVDPYRRGVGIVRAQSDELETHEYASKHAKQLFWNRAIPEFVVMDEGAGEPEITRHEEAFAQRLQGFWRWFKPYFTNRKLEFWQPTQMNLENLTMVPLMKHQRDVIVQAWGYPPEQLGIIESSNRATSETSDYILEKRVIRPRRENLRDVLQAKLVPEYDDRLLVGYVDTVPADKEHTLKVAQAAPHAMVLDEWREMMGLKPVGGDLGRARLVPLNSYLSTDPLDQNTRPAAAGGRPPKPDAAAAAAVRARRHVGGNGATLQ
jgi:phage portal protein BeeE